MRRVRLIEWNPTEARETASFLEAAGYSVESGLGGATQLLRNLRENRPVAVVIVLSRLPSQGRDVGLLLRQSKFSRSIPLVFVDGEREKVARIKKFLPDAWYTTKGRLIPSLRHAIASPPRNPTVARSVFDAYLGAPLVKKLGIKPNSTVALKNAPPGFEKKLRGLPEGVTVKHRVTNGADLTLWFNRSYADYVSNVKSIAATMGDGKLWIVWPKQGGELAGDLTEKIVRLCGLAAGLVDYKICSVDETWSALLFTRRKKRGRK